MTWGAPLLLALLAAATQPDARPTLAVLDPTVEGITKQEASVIGEAIRDAVVSAKTYRVQDRTAMREILNQQKFNASDACDENCSVEQGRLLQVGFLISSTLRRIGDTAWISVRLTDVASGEVKETARESCKCDVAAMVSVAEKVTRKVLGVADAAAAPAAAPVVEGKIGASVSSFNPATGAEPVIVVFESTPPGAVVLLDGRMLCQSTPCSKEIVTGTHTVAMEKERHQRAEDKVSVQNGSKVALTLAPVFGWLSVETVPAALGISVNGKPARSPLREMEIDPGGHEVVVDDLCWLREGERVAVKIGERRTVKIEAHARMAAIRVSAEDDKGNAVEGKVVVDGLELGRTPGTFKVPVCSRELSVAMPAAQWRTDLALKEGETAVVRASLSSSVKLQILEIQLMDTRNEIVKLEREKETQSGEGKRAIDKRLAKLKERRTKLLRQKEQLEAGGRGAPSAAQ